VLDLPEGYYLILQFLQVEMLHHLSHHFYKLELILHHLQRLHLLKLYLKKLNLILLLL
jgi:hypothetical protein